MRIESLVLQDFGPFRRYEVEFTRDDNVSILLTGKNNEGKSSILNALRLLANALKVVGQQKQTITLEDGIYFRLLKQDTGSLKVRRLVHDYRDIVGKITGRFSDGFSVSVWVDPVNDMIYAERFGRIPSDIGRIFGFIPPLGPVSETEEIISVRPYLQASLSTSLAPRHLRNHLYQLLSKSEFQLVQQIIHESWPEIELLPIEVSTAANRIDCWYRERRIQRELCWAGQGLQIWIQIITHLVRLRHSQVLILDEPEINLHPEKQDDLVRILRQYSSGSIIIATHSVELMNNVHISHILNVKKTQRKPKLKDTSDRAYLEVVRAEVGSDFNFIASQFEDVDLIVFTEDTIDYKFLMQLASVFGRSAKTFNIPLHGFSEFKKAPAYKTAYEMLIGRPVQYRVILDRDYYPDDYLKDVRKTLDLAGITLVLTPGKELENMLFSEQLFYELCPTGLHGELKDNIEAIFRDLHTDCHASLVTLHQQFLPKRVDVKTILTTYGKEFDAKWNDKRYRCDLIAGKPALKRMRNFFRSKCESDLSDRILVSELAKRRPNNIEKFLADIFDAEEATRQSKPERK
jgi:hypothetical protein